MRRKGELIQRLPREVRLACGNAIERHGPRSVDGGIIGANQIDALIQSALQQPVTPAETPANRCDAAHPQRPAQMLAAGHQVMHRIIIGDAARSFELATHVLRRSFPAIGVPDQHRMPQFGQRQGRSGHIVIYSGNGRLQDHPNAARSPGPRQQRPHRAKRHRLKPATRSARLGLRHGRKGDGRHRAAQEVSTLHAVCLSFSPNLSG